MKKKEAVFLVLFILNTFYVLADEEIYNQWHYVAENFTADGIGYYIISLLDTQTRIEVNGKFPVIDNSTCETVDFYNICIDNTKVGYHNLTLDKDFYEANIIIYQMTSDLSLTKTIDKTNFIIGETANIEITIENTGSRESFDIEFEDPYPEEIRIGQMNGCLIQGNTVFWEGTLRDDRQKTCSYKIEAKNQVTFDSQAILSYNNGFEKKNLSSQKDKLIVEDFALKVEITHDENEIGEEFDVHIKLINTNNDYSVHIPYVRFRLPYQLKIISKPINVWEDKNVITFRGEIEPNSTEEFSFRVYSERAGTFKLKEEIRFLINRISNDFEKDKEIIVGLREPRIIHNLKDSYFNNETINFVLKIKNPSKKYRFSNPRIKINGIIDVFYHTPKLEKDTEIIALEIEINLSKFEDSVVQFNLSMTYETIYNQKLKLNIFKDITLVKVVKNITIENITVEMNITNENITEVDVTPDITFKEEVKKQTQINLIQTPGWVIVVILLFLLIDSFLVISILRKLKK